MGGWRKIKSKIVHKNPWYSVREDDVIRPDGKKGKYFVTDFDSIAVIAIDNNNKIYLVGQTRYPIGNIYSWEIITGGIKKGNSPLKTAKLELKEEAGVKAKKWTSLGYYHESNGVSSNKCYLFLAENLLVGKTNFEGTEDISIKKEKLNNIIKMIKDNKITDGLTIISIYKYLLFKKII